MGETVNLEEPVKLAVLSPDTTDIRIKLLKDGSPVRTIDNGNLFLTVNEPGVYRVEVFQLRRRFPFFSDSERPWIYSNPIFINKN